MYRLSLMLSRIAANFPSKYQPNKMEAAAELTLANQRGMAKIRNNLDIEEYRRVALTGYVVEPETEVPIGGILRLRIAENAEKSLVQFLDRDGIVKGFVA